MLWTQIVCCLNYLKGDSKPHDTEENSKQEHNQKKPCKMFNSTSATPGGHEEALQGEENQTHSHPHTVLNTLEWLKNR